MRLFPAAILLCMAWASLMSVAPAAACQYADAGPSGNYFWIIPTPTGNRTINTGVADSWVLQGSCESPAGPSHDSELHPIQPPKALVWGGRYLMTQGAVYDLADGVAYDLGREVDWDPHFGGEARMDSWRSGWLVGSSVNHDGLQAVVGIDLINHQTHAFPLPDRALVVSGAVPLAIVEDLAYRNGSYQVDTLGVLDVRNGQWTLQLDAGQLPDGMQAADANEDWLLLRDTHWVQGYDARSGKLAPAWPADAYSKLDGARAILINGSQSSSLDLETGMVSPSFDTVPEYEVANYATVIQSLHSEGVGWTWVELPEWTRAQWSYDDATWPDPEDRTSAPLPNRPASSLNQNSPAAFGFALVGLAFASSWARKRGR